MQVAVADVSEAQRLDLRQRGGDGRAPGRQELADTRDRQGDVGLVRRVPMQGLADVLAQRPQAPRLGRCAREQGVVDLAGLGGVAEQRGELAMRLRACGLAGALHLDLDQGVARARLGEGRGAAAVREHVAQATVVEELEGRERRGAGTQAGEQRQDRGVVGHGAQGHEGVGGWATQSQRDLDDDTEGALGADEQLAQVVAGVVLDEGAPELEARARGDDGLEPEHPVTREAVAQHLHAAGVGGQAAADLRRALGGVVDRVEQAVGRGGLVHRLQRDAGLATQGAGGDVDREHALHLLQREHDLAGGRRGGAGQAGAPARGHDRHATAGAGPDHGLDLGDAAREHDHRRPHRPAAATAVRAVVGEVIRRVAAALVADRRDEVATQCEQVCGGAVHAWERVGRRAVGASRTAGRPTRVRRSRRLRPSSDA